MVSLSVLEKYYIIDKQAVKDQFVKYSNVSAKQFELFETRRIVQPTIELRGRVDQITLTSATSSGTGWLTCGSPSKKYRIISANFTSTGTLVINLIGIRKLGMSAWVPLVHEGFAAAYGTERFSIVTGKQIGRAHV